LNRFPAFCAVLVGGSTLLTIPFRLLFIALLRLLRGKGWRGNLRLIDRAARFLAALIAAALSFSLINSGPGRRVAAKTTTPITPNSSIPNSTLSPQAGASLPSTTNPAPAILLPSSQPVTPTSTVPLAGKTPHKE